MKPRNTDFLCLVFAGLVIFAYQAMLTFYPEVTTLAVIAAFITYYGFIK